MRPPRGGAGPSLAEHPSRDNPAGPEIGVLDTAHEKAIFPQEGVARGTLESLGAARSSLETPYAARKWVNR